MNRIVININPVALNLGYLHVNCYSIITMLAILAAIGLAVWEGKRKGFSSDSIFSLAPSVVIDGLIGARLFIVSAKPRIRYLQT